MDARVSSHQVLKGISTKFDTYDQKPGFIFQLVLITNPSREYIAASLKFPFFAKEASTFLKTVLLHILRTLRSQIITLTILVLESRPLLPCLLFSLLGGLIVR